MNLHTIPHCLSDHEHYALKHNLPSLSLHNTPVTSSPGFTAKLVAYKTRARKKNSTLIHGRPLFASFRAAIITRPKKLPVNKFAPFRFNCDF